MSALKFQSFASLFTLKNHARNSCNFSRRAFRGLIRRSRSTASGRSLFEIDPTTTSQLPSYFVPNRFATPRERDRASFTERLLKDHEILSLEREATLPWLSQRIVRLLPNLIHTPAIDPDIPLDWTVQMHKPGDIDSGYLWGSLRDLQRVKDHLPHTGPLMLVRTSPMVYQLKQEELSCERELGLSAVKSSNIFALNDRTTVEAKRDSWGPGHYMVTMATSEKGKGVIQLQAQVAVNHPDGNVLEFVFLPPHGASAHNAVSMEIWERFIEQSKPLPADYFNRFAGLTLDKGYTLYHPLYHVQNAKFIAEMRESDQKILVLSLALTSHTSVSMDAVYQAVAPGNWLLAKGTPMVAVRASVRARHERIWFKNASPRHIPVKVKRVSEFSIDTAQLAQSHPRVSWKLLEADYENLASREKCSIVW